MIDSSSSSDFGTSFCDGIVGTRESVVYSLSMIIHEMLSGEEPFSEDKDLNDVVEKISLSIRPDIDSLMISNEEEKEFISSMWDEELSSRPSLSDVISFFSSRIDQ